MTSLAIEWCELNLSDQEEYLALLSRFAQQLLKNESVYVEICVDTLYGWHFMVNHGDRNLISIRDREAIELGERLLGLGTIGTATSVARSDHVRQWLKT